jgi:hypothetical protein
VLCFAQRGGKGEGEGEGRTWWVPRRRRSAPPGEREGDVASRGFPGGRQSSAGRRGKEGGKTRRERQREKGKGTGPSEEIERERWGWPDGRAGRCFFFCILALCIVCRKKKQVLRKIFQAICFERCHLHLCEWVLETFLLTFFKKKYMF